MRVDVFSQVKGQVSDEANRIDKKKDRRDDDNQRESATVMSLDITGWEQSSVT